jgi:hypothetical protein
VTLRANTLYGYACMFAPCWPRDGEVVPATHYPMGVRVTFGTAPQPTSQNMSGQYLYAAGGGYGEILHHNTTSSTQHLYYMRPSADGGGYCYNYLCYPADPCKTCQTWVEQYRYEGPQPLLVTQVPPPLRVTASKSWIATGESVLFTSLTDGERRHQNGAAAETLWQWVPNDTLAAPGTGPGMSVCYPASGPTCSYSPVQSGRMRASTYVEGNSVASVSEIVWVNGPRLDLQCTATVTRGAGGTCTASSNSPLAPLSVAAWKFEGGGRTVAPPPGSPQSSAPVWSGAMVVSGAVTVEGTVANRLMTASAPISVLPRTWPKMVVTGILGGHGNLPDPPRRYRDLGVTLVPPTPAVPVDAQLVQSGPNQGFWFLGSLATQLQATVHINRAFTPGHPWYQMQHSGPTGKMDSAGNPTYYCTKTQIKQLEVVTRQHEGLVPGGAQLSHLAAVNSFFDTTPVQVDLERVVVHDDQLSQEGYASGRAYMEHQYVVHVQEPLRADGRYNHTGEGGQVPSPPFPCEARLQP